MILLVDAGNSRIKWGVYDAGMWLRQAAVETTAAVDLEVDWQQLPSPTAIAASNVAGPGVRVVLERLFSRWQVAPQWVAAAGQQCGVRNAYDAAAQLGPDRWAALIAARHVSQEACLVVNVGTAVTVDALSREGVFLGGLILPGLQLMHAALASGTAGVRGTTGQWARFPTNTADAVYSGAMQAVLGAIERMAREVESSAEGSCTVWLSGGGAQPLAPLLNRPVMLVDNLVLEGLLIIAQEGAAG